jgi:carboxymethylenebutenolidase
LPRPLILEPMKEKTIRVRTADGELPVFVAHPESGGPFSLALLLMDGVGFREQIKENVRRFAADGYFCFAPDFYYRAGEGLHFNFAAIMAEGPEGPTRKRMIEVARSLNPEKAVADVKAALAAIASDPAAASDGPLVCVGYCMGARLALCVASELADRVVAAAGIHPGALVSDQPDSPHHELARVRGELYFAFAEQDQSATPELVHRFQKEMARHGVRGEVERLPGTAHGFAMADLPVYQREAAERHFEQTLELWRRNLRQPVSPGS